jgi:hypothetical protein
MRGGRALLLNQRELRDRLRLRLNGGKPGWNHDEHFVVGSVYEVAVRKVFPAGPDLREVTAFVTDMRSRIHSTNGRRRLSAAKSQATTPTANWARNVQA